MDGYIYHYCNMKNYEMELLKPQEDHFVCNATPHDVISLFAFPPEQLDMFSLPNRTAITLDCLFPNASEGSLAISGEKHSSSATRQTTMQLPSLKEFSTVKTFRYIVILRTQAHFLRCVGFGKTKSEFGAI